MKSISKKVLAGIAGIAMSMALVAGAVGSFGGNADTTELNKTTAGVAFGGTSASRTIQVTDVYNGSKTYEIPVVAVNEDTVDEIQSLIGVDYDSNGNKVEYYLGTAALFAVFAEDTIDVANRATATNVADIEGRIAAPTVLNNSGRSYTFGGRNSNGSEADGRAIIICENNGKVLQGVQPVAARARSNWRVVVSTGIGKLDEQTAGMAVATSDGIIDFAAEFDALRAKSEELSKLQANTGVVKNVAKTWSLIGYNKHLNVFRFTEEQWSEAKMTELHIYVPRGSYAVINVPGEKIEYFVAGGVYMHFFDDPEKAEEADRIALGTSNAVEGVLEAKTHLLFNFYEAREVNFKKQVKGNVLAPNAIITGGSGHTYGQLIGTTVHVDVQQDKAAFTMPDSYIDKADKVVKYTAHYVYLDTNGNYQELPSKVFKAPSVSTGLEEAYDAKDVLNVLNKKAFSGLANVAPYNEEDYTLVWEAYKDGKDIYGATEGADLLKKDTYKGMTYLGTIPAGSTYTFTDSNVYLVAKLVTKVNVDVTFVDGGNASKRPDSIMVTLGGTNGGTSSVDTSADVLSSTKVDGYDAVVTADQKLKLELPVLDANGKVIDYTKNGLTYAAVPGYSEYKGVEVTNEDGVATYHIALKREYNTRFYIVDTNGKEIEKTNEYLTGFNGLNRLAGTNIDNMPTIAEEDMTTVSPAYKIFWVDRETGAIYEQGQDDYIVPARDVELVAKVMLDEAHHKRPKWASNMIFANGKYELSKSTMELCLGWNNAFTKFGKYNVAKLGCNDLTEKFYFLSLMTGAPKGVTQIEWVISLEGYDVNPIFTYTFNTDVNSAEDEVIQTFGSFGEYTEKYSSFKNYAELFEDDRYLEDYRGMVLHRFILPAEYANKPLYLTTYYKYQDPTITDVYWGRYTFVMSDEHEGLSVAE